MKTEVDSDSSGDEGEQLTETNVILGYASKEEAGDPINHLGGFPVGFSSACGQNYTLIRSRLGLNQMLRRQLSLQNVALAMVYYHCSFSSMAISPNISPMTRGGSTCLRAGRSNAAGSLAALLH